jgi:hypothetical protein
MKSARSQSLRQVLAVQLLEEQLAVPEESAVSF